MVKTISHRLALMKDEYTRYMNMSLSEGVCVLCVEDSVCLNLYSRCAWGYREEQTSRTLYLHWCFQQVGSQLLTQNLTYSGSTSCIDCSIKGGQYNLHSGFVRLRMNCSVVHCANAMNGNIKISKPLISEVPSCFISNLWYHMSFYMKWRLLLVKKKHPGV